MRSLCCLWWRTHKDRVSTHSCDRSIDVSFRAIAASSIAPPLFAFCYYILLFLVHSLHFSWTHRFSAAANSSNNKHRTMRCSGSNLSFSWVAVSLSLPWNERRQRPIPFLLPHYPQTAPLPQRNKAIFLFLPLRLARLTGNNNTRTIAPTAVVVRGHSATHGASLSLSPVQTAAATISLLLYAVHPLSLQ